jgi:hypothetical protein
MCTCGPYAFSPTASSRLDRSRGTLLPLLCQGSVLTSEYQSMAIIETQCSFSLLPRALLEVGQIQRITLSEVVSLAGFQSMPNAPDGMAT